MRIDEKEAELLSRALDCLQTMNQAILMILAIIESPENEIDETSTVEVPQYLDAKSPTR